MGLPVGGTHSPNEEYEVGGLECCNNEDNGVDSRLDVLLNETTTAARDAVYHAICT